VRRLSLRRPATAWMLVGLVLLLAAALIPLSLLARQNALAATGPQIASAVAFAAVGLVVARHRPGNAIGWLMLCLGAGILLYTDTGLYNVVNYRLGHHLPCGPAVLLVYQLSEPMLGLLPLVILVFPDGRLPSRRWRWVVRGYVAAGLADVIVLLAMGGYAIASHRTQVDAGGQLSLASHDRGYQAVSALAAVIFLALWLLAVGYQVVCWRRSAGETRQQLNWLMAGGAAALTSFVVAAGLDTGHGVWQLLGDVVLIGVAALPAGMGVAILKFKLYEIDRIISRTLAYAIVTGLLVGVYAGLVLLTRQVFRADSPVAVAASTLAAAALFTPLRRWVQRVVDQRFNRVRYDADRMVEAFAARLKDATDLDMVRQELAGVVNQALEPAHVTLWTRPDSQPRQLL
jgi:hypothetical protein